MEPVPVEPAQRLAPLDGLAQVCMAALWLVALAQVAAWIAAGSALAHLQRPGLVVVTVVLLVDLACLLVALVTLALFIVWLYRARSNVDALPGAQPDWSRGWTVGSWFIPVGNLIIPAIVVADVARQSADDVAGRETSRQVTRVWAWWSVGILQALLGWFWQFILTPLLVVGLGRYVRLDQAVIYTVVSPAFGVILAVAGGYLGSRMVGGITREQRLRVERVWAGNAAEARAAGVIA